jgi:hypothetical protein
MEQIEYYMERPGEVQEAQFQKLISRGRLTAWGAAHGYEDLHSYADFQARVPVSSYEQLFPWIERSIAGAPDVLWPGRVSWFAKSSGTTNDKSKYIPVTEESLEDCHYKAGQDMLALYFAHKPDSRLFTGKSLSIGGTHTLHPLNPHARLGDVSAVILENLPVFYEMVRAPRKEIALMADWEQKLIAMEQEIIFDDITSIVGVPTWTLVLINRLLDKMQISSRNLLEIWPNLELYIHGGVSFDPYRPQFEAISGGHLSFLDCYNASEGFFGVQLSPESRDLLLLLDCGVFYEFIPLEDLGTDAPPAHTLDEVDLHRNYAMVISTNGGLWRYLIGDTVMFTGKSPYTFRVTGRTRQFINIFGEELMVDNADTAITTACQETGALVRDYTAGPVFPDAQGQGGHEWLIEFERMPDSLDRFGWVLDQTLKAINSDYEAKRHAGLALQMPRIQIVPDGTFHHWMKNRGRLGGQNKVPRLSNTRQHLDSVFALLETQGYPMHHP